LTFDDYLDHFKWRSLTLMAGRYDDLARHYSVPLSMELDGTTCAVKDGEDLVLQLHRLRIALLERGIAKLVPQVLAISLPGKMQTVWLDWQSVDASGKLGPKARSVYGMSNDGGGLKAAAVQHTALIIPEFTRQSYRERLVRSRYYLN
jgi:hypothetical protein